MADFRKTISLPRDCRATIIPFGLKAVLSKGIVVNVKKISDGEAIVDGIFGEAKIDAENSRELFKDFLSELLDTPTSSVVAEKNAVAEENGNKPCTIGAAALSNSGAGINPEKVSKPDASANFTPDESELWEAAKNVFDPEIPVNIADLGLVYRLEIKKDSEGKNIVEADMSLTAPGCVMGPSIAEDLRLRLSAIPWVSEAKVSIVWDPPWNPDMMSEEARMILGLA